MRVVERTRRESDGFMLVELLIASVLAMVVIGVVVMAFVAANQSAPRAESDATVIAQARVTMEPIVRELRESSGLVAGTTVTPSHLSVVTYVHGACDGRASSTVTQCSVTYDCSAGICTRQVAKTDGTSPGPAVRVVSGLASNNVFSCSPNCSVPTYFGVTLSFPSHASGNAITLTDGAALRNATSS